MRLFRLKDDYKKGDLSKPEYIKRMAEIHAVFFDYSRFISETDIAKIEITSDGVLVTTKFPEVKMLCMEQERRAAPFEILNFDSYEKDHLDMMLKLIDKNTVFYDIGANIGWYSINLAKLVRGIKVFAFEPIPKTFGFLEKNVKINQMQNIESYNFGFSNKEDELKFFYYPEGTGNASIANVSGRENVQKITCKVKRLDDFVAEKKTGIDFIKCDVEGAELLVFQGGIHSIEEFKPIIFTEMLRKWSAKFNYQPNDIIRLLHSIGYKCFVVGNGKLVEIPEVNNETIETNFFFLHQTKHRKLLNI